MGRRKVSMGLVPNRRVRAATFGKRKEGLKKKAVQLSVLCGVDVALVVAGADAVAGAGAGAADVWESREGVLARYRALDPEARARHTHRGYLHAELGKEEAKLARVRQGGPDGLARWDKALDGIATAEEARRLLDAVDAAIRAAEARRRALGMPAAGDEDGAGAGVVIEGVAPLGFSPDDYLLPAPAGAADDQAAMWAGNGFPFQQGGAAANNMQQAGGYGFQQCTSGAGMEGYHLQMAPDMYGGAGGSSSSSGGRVQDAHQHYHQQPDAGAMQHGYGFQRAPSGYYAVPSGYQPDLGMWSADEPRLAMVPFEYASADAGLNYMDTPAAHGGQGSGDGSFAMGGGDNFMNSTPALNLAMGTGGNFINASPAGPSHNTMNSSGDNFTNATPVQPMPLAMCYGGDLTNAGRYAVAQWQQAAPQPQRAGGEQQAGIEQLHYLSDLEDTQLHLWGN